MSMTASELARRWVELYNDGTQESYGSDRFCDLYAEDVDWREMPSAFFPSGRTGDAALLRQAVADTQALLRDRRFDVDEYLEDGDRVAAIGTWSAVPAVDGLGVPVGERIAMGLAMFFEVRGDKIVRQRDYPTRIASADS